MKITRDKQSKFWTLSSDSHVLYKGRKSPWDDPTIIREAQQREQGLRPNPQSAGKKQ
jgi:hypothetical protein